MYELGLVKWQVCGPFLSGAGGKGMGCRWLAKAVSSGRTTFSPVKASWRLRGVGEQVVVGGAAVRVWLLQRMSGCLGGISVAPLGAAVLPFVGSCLRGSGAWDVVAA